MLLKLLIAAYSILEIASYFQIKDGDIGVFVLLEPLGYFSCIFLFYKSRIGTSTVIILLWLVAGSDFWMRYGAVLAVMITYYVHFKEFKCFFSPIEIVGFFATIILVFTIYTLLIKLCLEYIRGFRERLRNRVNNSVR